MRLVRILSSIVTGVGIVKSSEIVSMQVRTPPWSMSPTKSTGALYNDVAFMRAFGASGYGIAVCCGFEEVHSLIRTVWKHIVISDEITHVG